MRGHWSSGLRLTRNSGLKNPVASVPSSARPTWDSTIDTSGNDRKILLASCATVVALFSETLSGIVARAQMLPSSSFGRNSPPSSRKRDTGVV
jgi:hypothetical protein